MSKKRGARRKVQNSKIKINNSQVQTSTGQGSTCDLGVTAQPQASVRNSHTTDRDAVELYDTDWQFRKIVNIPVEDMMREGWDYVGFDDDQSKTIDTTEDLLGVRKAVFQALRLERLLGGCVIAMGTSDTDDVEQLKEPLDVESINEGDLKFLNVIPRTLVSKTSFDSNPLSADYGRPETYIIQSTQIHRSRLIIFDGDPLISSQNLGVTSFRRMRNDGFGESVLTPVYDDLLRSTGSRQAAFHLIQRASVLLMKTNLMNLEGTTQGEAKIAQLQDIANQINMFNGALLDNSPSSASDIDMKASQFGSVPELVMTYLQVLCAAADIPATRYIGITAGGLNSSGDSELENYYNNIAAKQQDRLRPQLMKLLNVMGRSALGNSFDINEIEIEFPALWNMSEVEKAQVRTADTQNIVSMEQAGILSENEAIAEAKVRGLLLTDVKDKTVEFESDDENLNIDENLKLLGDQ